MPDNQAAFISSNRFTARQWQQELIPLPKEFKLTASINLTPDKIKIQGRSQAKALEKICLNDLTELFRQKTGLLPDGCSFTILVGLLDSKNQIEGHAVTSAARLRQAPNSEQAYVIQPLNANTLGLTALTEQGLFYATRTLSQWLELHLSPTEAEIPLADILDWPDLKERAR